MSYTEHRPPKAKKIKKNMLKIVRAGNFRLNFVISYNVLYWKFVTMELIIGVENCVRNVENSLQQFSKLFSPNWIRLFNFYITVFIVEIAYH